MQDQIDNPPKKKSTKSKKLACAHKKQKRTPKKGVEGVQKKLSKNQKKKQKKASRRGREKPESAKKGRRSGKDKTKGKRAKAKPASAE